MEMDSSWSAGRHRSHFSAFWKVPWGWKAFAFVLVGYVETLSCSELSDLKNTCMTYNLQKYAPLLIKDA